MSDYHIRTQDIEKKSANVVFHIPVPGTGQNEAGLTWREAAVREQGGSENIASILNDISPEETTKLKAGEVLEIPKTVRFSSKNLTPAQRKAEIETAFSNLKTEIIDDKQATLEWIGYSGNIT